MLHGPKTTETLAERFQHSASIDARRGGKLHIDQTTFVLDVIKNLLKKDPHSLLVAQQLGFNSKTGNTMDIESPRLPAKCETRGRTRTRSPLLGREFPVDEHYDPKADPGNFNNTC